MVNDKREIINLKENNLNYLFIKTKKKTIKNQKNCFILSKKNNKLLLL